MTRFYGYEVSTEGDAFLVAFHEPFDAAAWCLAVQIALHYAPWPERLLLHKNSSVETAASLLQKRSARRQRWQEKLADSGQAAAATAAAVAAGGGGAGGVPAARDQAGAPGPLGPREHAAAVRELEGSIGSLTDSGPLLAAAGEHEGDSGGADGGAGAEDGLGPLQGGGRWSQPFEPHSPSKVPLGALFRGLRVRMSLATGRAEDVRLHTVTQRHEYGGSVLRRVQAVAETPHGGQVIMDPDTFQGIHARLPELGGAVLDATQKFCERL
ncbi:hypothetical protein MNEG_16144 [Monoraphidium neglectum]|uniref:Guanylate cyclase domain-containing protein n=1 Tax=Monoraphidium neglectum TaxID=145388 RepID=A0A0D2LIH0_9CHLO|nr:hypothetical protein MNEG_16144 [Monoraphidium neglectum]KIY91819.1 hypothetical protein MNEG_16144 [Monoraphidium neglectum]|eukprot:XP_013890839.1 hypothetical protein MNEG_16144 [Monoraphidium neglectum]